MQEVLVALATSIPAAAATILGILWQREKKQGREDRALTEELRGQLHLELSVSCGMPSCPRQTVTISTGSGAAPAGDPTSGSPANG